jgi:hypothetical protein
LVVKMESTFVLIRWDYVLSVDFLAGQTKTVGLIP